MEHIDNYHFNNKENQSSRKSINFRSSYKNISKGRQPKRTTLQGIQNSLVQSLLKVQTQLKAQIFKQVRFKGLNNEMTDKKQSILVQQFMADTYKQSSTLKGNRKTLGTEIKSIIESQNIKQVICLLKSPIQSKSFKTSEMKCLMIHFQYYNDYLISKKHIFKIKKKLEISNLQKQSTMSFKYFHLNSFLKSLKQQNYNSQQTVFYFQQFQRQSVMPISIHLMCLYLGSYLYQVNGMYQKSIDILKKMLNQILKHKLEQLTYIYLILMVRLKINLLQWKQSTFYLMKILAYAWQYDQDDLQIWCYFQLSRSYFFMNKVQQSQFYKKRSQMSITQPKFNIYRQIIIKQYILELEQMKKYHKHFQLIDRINIHQFFKMGSQQFPLKEKNNDSIKIQTQIKKIQQKFKITHVKNLLGRISDFKKIQLRSTCNAEQRYSFRQKGNKPVAGNPLLKSHESGLKNLNIYFRNNDKTKKNGDNKFYTLQNYHKSIHILNEMARNLILQMKNYIPILGNN